VVFLLVFLQQIPDLREESHFLWRADGGGFFLFLLEALQEFDHQEDAERDDEKVDHCLDERAVLDAGIAHGQRQCGEIEFAEHQTECRHDEVVDQRGDDLTKGRSDDDGDGEIHHIALHGEVSEFFEHGGGGGRSNRDENIRITGRTPDALVIDIAW
jgi:hypothetical protein